MKIKLSDRLDHLVRARCCKPRHYEPADLIKVFGDVPIHHLELHMFKCEECGIRDCMDVRLVYPTAAERQAIKVRRLVKIRIIKRPIWREE